MMTLSQEEKGLPQKISDDIVALILEENLKPGDKLPNETILSQRLDVGSSGGSFPARTFDCCHGCHTRR